MKGLFEDIHRRDPRLSQAGWMFIGLAMIFLVGAMVDDRELLGVNLWLKPLKFSLSIAVFLWTMGWVLSELRLNYKQRMIIGMMLIMFMMIEIMAIGGQSLREETSHFNFSSSLNATIFYIMGIAIALNTMIVGLMLVLFFKKKLALAPSYLWGIRLGLFFLVLGSIQGGYIVQYMSHTVGAADGGTGLAFLNWSTQHGDLRVAHFMGLHGAQVMIALGYWLSQKEKPGQSRAWVIALVATLYFLVTVGLFWQAFQGKSITSLL